MADRATVAPTRVTLPGVAQPAQQSGVEADGHKIRNNGHVIIECETTGAEGALVFTFQTPGKQIGEFAIDDLEVSVGQGAVKVAGPFPPGLFNQGDGEIYLDYDVTHYALQKIRVYQIAD